MLKFVVLAILSVPSIMAASIWEQMIKALTAENDTGKLQTFQTLREKLGDRYTPGALVEVAKKGHLEIVATCLKAERDPFPNDKMCVSRLMSGTIREISDSTEGDAESFAKMITSFTPTDAKPLASIRYNTLDRGDAVNVLERVMDQVPELITDTLPSWLASHRFDRNSCAYKYNQTARERAFQYLGSFATENVLKAALSIVKAKEHYKSDTVVGLQVMCCYSQADFPQDLVDKLTVLLGFVKARNQLIKDVLQFLLPKVLVDLMLDYLRTDTI
jgi:hypothetical protein